MEKKRAIQSKRSKQAVKLENKHKKSKLQPPKKTETDYEIAHDFAIKAYRQFRDIIKSIVLFSPVPTLEKSKKEDIDIVVILDDCTIQWDQELIAWYREELSKLVAKQPYVKKLHITTVTLSTFWDEIRSGQPLTINLIRYGQALIDFGGFFDPLKVLLAKGKIKPTPESVMVLMNRSLENLWRSNANILTAVEGLHWAMVDVSHAALMAVNVTPPSPEHVADLLKAHFVSNKKLDKKYVYWYEEIRLLAKKISFTEVKKVDGKELETLQRKAKLFVDELTSLTKLLISHEKIISMNKKQI